MSWGSTEARPNRPSLGDAVVPLFTPDPRLLRAGAVWIVVANWADAVTDRYGAASIIAGDETLTSTDVRTRLTLSPASGRGEAPAWRRTAPAIAAETLAKDLRWWRTDRKLEIPDLAPYGAAPFVWQYHSLFQLRGHETARRLGVPLVLHVDAPQVWEARKWGVTRPIWGKVAERMGDSVPLRRADLVAAVSQAVADAVEHLGVDPARIIITPGSAAMNLTVQADRVAVRAELGLDGASVIGWIGSFRKFHALELLVDAFTEVAALDPKAHLLLVGDGPEAPEVRRRLEATGMGDRVRMTGSVPHHEVGRFVAAMDLTVLPSREGAFHYAPLKLRESLATGVPVIASDVGEVPGIVRASGGGWVVAPGDERALAAAIRTALDDQPARLAAGRRGATYAESELGHSVGLDRVIERLDALGPPRSQAG